jgi:hypothetical protein
LQVFEDALEDTVEVGEVEGEISLGQGLLEAQLAIGRPSRHIVLTDVKSMPDDTEDDIQTHNCFSRQPARGGL